IIRMRKEVPEVGWGDFTVIPTRDPAVLVMRYDWRNNWVLFVHNLDAKPREVTFSVGLDKEHAEESKPSSISWARSTAAPTRTASIGWWSKVTAIVASASAGSTICFGAVTSTGRQAGGGSSFPKPAHAICVPLTSSSRVESDGSHATCTLVGGRRHLPDLSALVSGQQRRWHWRLARNHATLVVSGPTRHRCDLVDADFPLADGGLRLRHFGLYRH